MRTVFISITWFHPAFRAGGPIQSIANMVNELAGEFKFYIFCGDTDLNKVALENIETGKWIQYNKQTKVWYAKPAGRSSTLLKQVKELKPDHLFLIGSFSWHFNIVPLIFCKSVQKIVSVRGSLFPGALAQKSFKKKVYLSIFKLFGLQHSVIFHATDNAEKNSIENVLGSTVKVLVAGNFPRKFVADPVLEKHKGRLQLASIALIYPLKNHLLVLKALEQCTAEVDYHIYGPVKDMQYWQRCLEQIKRMPPNINVVYHGEVQPPNVEQALKLCHVFILTSESENFGHSIYEALSAGKPVITSNFTPWNQLQSNKCGLNVATDPDEIRIGIGFFALMNQDEYREWSEAAANYANRNIDIVGLKEQYRNMFNSNNIEIK